MEAVLVVEEVKAEEVKAGVAQEVRKLPERFRLDAANKARAGELMGPGEKFNELVARAFAAITIKPDELVKE